MRYFWGLFFIALGAGYLSASLGYIDYSQIGQLFRWWPLALIFVGFDMIFKKFKTGWVVMLVLTVIAGYAIYDISFSPVSYLTPKKQFREERKLERTGFSITQNSLAKKAAFEIKTGAIDFSIKGVSEKLATGDLESNISKLETEDVLKGETQSVEISTMSKSKHVMWFGGFKNILKLALSDRIPIDLKVISGASRLNFDLTEYLISDVDIRAGASNIDLALGEKIQGGAKINIEAGASTIDITVPKKIGVRIKSETGLTTKGFEGFTRGEGIYENEAYKTAEKKIEIELKTGASTINIRQK